MSTNEPKKRGRPRGSKKSGGAVVLLDLDNSFLARARAVQATPDEIDLAGEVYGQQLPSDVLEEIARQQAAARPLLEQYHMLHEGTPTVALARATRMTEIDQITDIFTAMDLSEMGDAGDFPHEFACPRCNHKWSGDPDRRTGYGDKVYVPTGRVSLTTGKLQRRRYGPPRDNSASSARRWKEGQPTPARPDRSAKVLFEKWRKRRQG